MNIENSYRTPQSLGKAISEVCEKLPKSPQSLGKAISQVCGKLPKSPQKNRL